MEESDRARVLDLIGAAHREPAGGRVGLAAALHRWCWPGGGADRSDPVSRRRFRHWGPNLVGDVAVDCTCAAGRCPLCN